MLPLPPHVPPTSLRVPAATAAPPNRPRTATGAPPGRRSMPPWRMAHRRSATPRGDGGRASERGRARTSRDDSRGFPSIRSPTGAARCRRGADRCHHRAPPNRPSLRRSAAPRGDGGRASKRGARVHVARRLAKVPGHSLAVGGTRRGQRLGRRADVRGAL